MHLSLFDYHLPASRIAQHPVTPRDSSRLLIVDRKKHACVNSKIRKLPELLKSGDVLVFNDTKVIRARLYGNKESGGRIEVFLLRSLRPYVWEVLVGGRGIRKGMRLFFKTGVTCIIVSRETSGVYRVKFSVKGRLFDRFVEKVGVIPIPPYIKKTAKESEYQTVFAHPAKKGSVAAPTAGLHFTKQLLRKLKKRGVQIEYLTLHVGYGTFALVKQNDITKHVMHAEFVEVPCATMKSIFHAKKNGRRVIAVGTTTVRTLEGVLGTIERMPKKTVRKWINPFYYPGYRFRVIDGMLTNFHLPKSTLLMLVSAFVGRKKILQAYQRAIALGYRFYSFGDAMLIL